MMSRKIISLLLFAQVIILLGCSRQQQILNEVRLQDSISIAFLESNLSKKLPRMIFTPEKVKLVQSKVESDSTVKVVYQNIKKHAEERFDEPVVQRKVIGRRLLKVSREFLYRVNLFSAPYLIENDTTYLHRLNEEVLAVASFEDWNPSHYLDVAEIMLGMALALDWTAGALPDSTIIIAKRAIIEKGLLPGIDTSSEDNWWHDIENNWNQVCHGALVSGAITVFDQESELATKVINFATSRMPLALEEYAPDGVYPEGASYWGYGTSYSVLTASLLESALGTDLGISAFKGFKESAVFVLKAIAPSGKYFNFSDCGDEAKIHPYYLMTWFANSTGDCSMMNTEMLMQQSPELPRTCTPVLVWLSSFEEKKSSVIPQNWKGEGKNPVVVFTDTNDYYFACKGGSASLPHANMDAGSFVFETNKIRWSVDPGNQNYNDLEKIGFDLWNKAQDSERWTLLTKNNFGHSTVIINNELQKVKGHSEILSYMDGDTATVSINLTPQFGVNADSVVRTFTKPNNYSLVIEDNIRTNDSTKSISWQMMTTSEVTVEEDGFLLEEKGKQLKIRVLSPSKVKLKVVSLDPPPLQIDKIIPNLKRIEIAIQKPVAMGAIDIIVELENV